MAQHPGGGACLPGERPQGVGSFEPGVIRLTSARSAQSRTANSTMRVTRPGRAALAQDEVPGTGVAVADDGAGRAAAEAPRPPACPWWRPEAGGGVVEGAQEPADLSDALAV